MQAFVPSPLSSFLIAEIISALVIAGSTDTSLVTTIDSVADARLNLVLSRSRSGDCNSLKHSLNKRLPLHGLGRRNRNYDLLLLSRNMFIMTGFWILVDQLLNLHWKIGFAYSKRFACETQVGSSQVQKSNPTNLPLPTQPMGSWTRIELMEIVDSLIHSWWA